MPKLKNVKRGRPKTQFSVQQIKKAEDAAFVGCKNNTIAGLLGVRVEVFDKNFCKRLAKRRQERHYELRKIQMSLAKTNVAMAIFLGKNELGQTDQQNIKHDAGPTLAQLMLDAAKRNPVQKG